MKQVVVKAKRTKAVLTSVSTLATGIRLVVSLLLFGGFAGKKMRKKKKYLTHQLLVVNTA